VNLRAEESDGPVQYVDSQDSLDAGGGALRRDRGDSRNTDSADENVNRDSADEDDKDVNRTGAKRKLLRLDAATPVTPQQPQKAAEGKSMLRSRKSAVVTADVQPDGSNPKLIMNDEGL
jgi:hypothetical protein